MDVVKDKTDVIGAVVMSITSSTSKIIDYSIFILLLMFDICSNLYKYVIKYKIVIICYIVHEKVFILGEGNIEI